MLKGRPWWEYGDRAWGDSGPPGENMPDYLCVGVLVISVCEV
jgi:hypothetical protein